MKKKELQSLKTMSAAELEKRASELRENIMKTKLAIVSGKESNTRKARNMRHELAQVLTVKSIILKSEKKEEGENK